MGKAKHIFPDVYNDKNYDTIKDVEEQTGFSRSTVKNHIKKENVNCLADLMHSLEEIERPLLQRLGILPDTYKGIQFTTINQVTEYCNTSTANVRTYALKDGVDSLSKLISSIKLGRSSTAKEKGILPGVYNGVHMRTSVDVAEYCNVTTDLVSNHSKKDSVTTLEELIESLQNIRISTAKGKGIYPDSYDGKTFTCNRDVQNYLGCSERTVRQHSEKETVTTLKELIESIQDSTSKRRTNKGHATEITNSDIYPATVDGVTYTCDADVAKKVGAVADTIRKMRYKGYSVEKMLSHKFRKSYKIFKDEFPTIIRGIKYESIEDFIEKNSDLGLDSLNLQKRYRYFCTKRSYTLDEFYDALHGNYVEEKSKGISQKPKSSRSPKYLRKESCFWLGGVVLMPTIQEACNRLGVPKHRVKETSELGFIRAYISTRVADYDGSITPELSIEEFGWDLEGTKYYRVNLNGEVSYWSEYEIVEHRVSYLKIDKSVKDFTLYDGRYFNISDVYKFYGIANNSNIKESNEHLKELVIAASKRKSVVISDSEVVIGSRKTLRVSKPAYDLLKQGKITLEEARELTRKNTTTKPITITYPIFNKHKIVEMKTETFKSKKICLSTLGLDYSNTHKKMQKESINFSDAVSSILIGKQTLKVFIFELEFKDNAEMCRELALQYSSIAKDTIGVSDSDLEDYLFNIYYSKNNLTEYKKVVIKDKLYIKEYSFSDSDGVDFFLCSCLVGSRWVGKILSGKDLMQKKISDYKGVEVF